MNYERSATTGLETPPPDDRQRDVIRRHVDQIQNSHSFCNSARAKEFLTYVTEHAIGGRTEMLKERWIGVNLFKRAPTYITGDDPIVRVKAAEVRKRLAQYYSEEESAPEVRIEIPVGSYVPKFHWKPNSAPEIAPVSEVPSLPDAAPALEERQAHPSPLKATSQRWQIAGFTGLLIILGLAGVATSLKRTSSKSSFDAFWAPVFTTEQSVLICLASPITYAVSSDLYAKANQTNPGVYDSQVKRESTPIRLDPDTPMKWKDLTPLIDYAVNKDDAYVAADLTELFSRIHKGSQVRIGRDLTYEDLRNSPAVLIGAFDNPWTMRVETELPILLQEPGVIVERGGQGRTWRIQGDKRGSKDFALIARLRKSKTGQFLVIAAGIGMVGTQAAGRFISHPSELDAALRTAPKDWEDKNFELVIESDVIEDSASPPRVVALRSW
jgi:hypothetical protein